MNLIDNDGEINVMFHTQSEFDLRQIEHRHVGSKQTVLRVNIKVGQNVELINPFVVLFSDQHAIDAGIVVLTYRLVTHLDYNEFISQLFELVVRLQFCSDTETVLQLLVRKGDMVFACEAPTPRTRKAEEIGTMLESQKIKAEFKAEHSVDEALSDAAAAAGENDIVMICGSLYILGDAIRFIEEKEASAAEETK